LTAPPFFPAIYLGRENDATEARAVVSVVGEIRAVRFGDTKPDDLVPGDRVWLSHERNFIHLSTALFARSLVADGCRFDEAFEIMQDWDFFLQCAQLTPFHFEPRQTFEWRVDLGTSGTGVGGNRDAARFARFRDAIYAKWGARRQALAARVKQLVDDATAKLRLGDFDGAEARCNEALAVSPGDPWALNSLALVYRSTGRLRDAELAQTHAVAVRPNNPSLLYNLAEIHRARGDLARARGCLQRALELAPDFASAQTMLAALDPRRE